MSADPVESVLEQPAASPARMTLKEAAERTGRSVTTLRRYIRSLRLKAEKVPGRFGPEYTLDEQALQAAGFQTLPHTPAVSRSFNSTAVSVPDRPHEPVVADRSGSRPLEKLLQDYVPADLYRELVMKHEQLLVQYGMVRASGQRLFEYRDEAERSSEQLHRSQERQKELQDHAGREIGLLRQKLRRAELDLEEKGQEISVMREKVRVLELLARNATTTESIEKLFLKVFEKERHVDALVSGASRPAAQEPARSPHSAPPGPLAAEDGAGLPQPRGASLQGRGAHVLDRWLATVSEKPSATDELDH